MLGHELCRVCRAKTAAGLSDDSLLVAAGTERRRAPPQEEKELRPTQTSLATAVVEPAVRVNRQNQRKSTRKGTIFAVLDHDADNVADLCRFYNFKRWCLLQSARHDMKAKWPE